MLHEIHKNLNKELRESVFRLGYGTGLSIEELTQRNFELSWAQINFPGSNEIYSDDDAATSYRIWLYHYYNNHYHNGVELNLQLNNDVQLSSKVFYISHERNIPADVKKPPQISKSSFNEECKNSTICAGGWITKIYVNVNCIFLPNINKNLHVEIKQKKHCGNSNYGTAMSGYTKIIANLGDMYVLKITNPFTMK